MCANCALNKVCEKDLLTNFELMKAYVVERLRSDPPSVRDHRATCMHFGNAGMSLNEVHRTASVCVNVIFSFLNLYIACAHTRLRCYMWQWFSACGQPVSSRKRGAKEECENLCSVADFAQR